MSETFWFFFLLFFLPHKLNASETNAFHFSSNKKDLMPQVTPPSLIKFNVQYFLSLKALHCTENNQLVQHLTITGA